jgi:hypothetical protein
VCPLDDLHAVTAKGAVGSQAPDPMSSATETGTDTSARPAVRDRLGRPAVLDPVHAKLVAAGPEIWSGRLPVHPRMRAVLHQVLAARRDTPGRQRVCALQARLSPEPSGRWSCPVSRAGRLGK